MIMGDRMEKIKPCPFCGADPEVRDWMCGFCVSCENRECPCMPTSFVYDTKEEAINFWNRRPGEEDAYRRGVQRMPMEGEKE